MRLLLLVWIASLKFNVYAQEHVLAKPTFKNIPEILVKPAMGIMRISRDTIEYKINERIDPFILKVEDLFKDFLGFNISESGKIFYNGIEISYLLIDGEFLSTTDYRILTQHMNAYMFHSIEIIQPYHINRFENLSVIKNEIALNLKLKKEYRNRFNTDVSFLHSLLNGVHGNAEGNRIGMKFQSISAFKKNIFGEYWELTDYSTNEINQHFVEQISIIQDPMLYQTFGSKQKYLQNNTGSRLEMVHVFNVGPHIKLHVEPKVEHIELSTRKDQHLSYFIGEHTSIQEERTSQLTVSSNRRQVNFLLVHDHFKNNRGEYNVYYSDQQQYQQLQDAISGLNSNVFAASDQQTHHSLIFHGNEKLLLQQKYLLEVHVQGGSNRLARLLENSSSLNAKNIMSQQFLSTDVGFSLQKRKMHAHMGSRYIIEQRELSNLLSKSYLYIEHQYRLNKKLLFNTDLSIGRGTISNPLKQLVKVIYQLEAGVVYKKTVFNQSYVRYFMSQKLPSTNTWLFNSLPHLSGYMQYAVFPDRFTVNRKIDFGKTYQHLYRGIGFNYGVSTELIRNGIFHAIGLRQGIISDTISLHGDLIISQLRIEADQFLFPIKIRIAASLQYTSNKMNQALMGMVFPIQLYQPTFKFTAKSSWEKAFQWEASTNVQYNYTHSTFRSNASLQFHHQLNAKYTFNKKVFASIQSSISRIEKQPNYFFLDALLHLKSTEKIKVKLSVLNALNLKSFQYQYINNLGVQTVSTPLAGRKIQLEVIKIF